MDALKIAELKDNILKYLAAAQNKKVLLLDMYRDLKPKNIPISVVKDYMEDMAQDGEIIQSQRKVKGDYEKEDIPNRWRKKYK
jgi:hypothetical protein